MADSTSRWAQALREMSNRLEELPGPEAFPMDLSAIISNFYGRAGYVILNNGKEASITFIGTVSPAGGNLKEPVTENTKKVARCFTHWNKSVPIKALSGYQPDRILFEILGISRI